MNINENQKITLTIGQLKRLIREASEDKNQTEITTNSELPIDDLGKVLRLNACKRQREMCWEYDGFVLVHKELNPEFDENKPFMPVAHTIYEGKDLGWNFHFAGGFTGNEDKSLINDLLSALSDSCKRGMEFRTAAFTPGGISGYTKLINYGFKKIWLPVDSMSYWTATTEHGGHLDVEKTTKWLNSGEHLDEFLVKTEDGKFISPKDYDGEFTIDNTVPRPFKMVKA